MNRNSTLLEDATKPVQGSPKSPSIICQLFFTHLTPLLRLARQKTLTSDDLSRLLPMSDDLDPRRLTARLTAYLQQYGQDAVFKSLMRFLLPYYVVTVLTEMAAVLVVGQRTGLLTSYTNEYARQYESTDVKDRLGLIAGSFKIAVVSLLPPLIEGFSYFKLFELAGRLRVAVTGLITERLLLSAHLGPIRIIQDQIIKTGRLVNLLGVDVQDLQDGVVFMSPLFVMPVQVIQAIIMVVSSAVVKECAVGLIVAIAYVIVQIALMMITKRQLATVKAASDARIRLTVDLIRQQRTIKQLGFLQQCTDQISKLRQLEVTAMRVYLLLLTVTDCLHMLVSPLTETVIIYTMAQNNTLSLSRMVMVKELVAIVVRRVLVYAPDMVRSAPAVMVSVARLADFLRVTSSRGTEKTPATAPDKVDISCERVTFFTAAAHRSSKTTAPLSLAIGRGQRVLMVGKTGSGKSTIMDGLAEALPLSSGRLQLSSSAAYLPQSACIFAGSIRDNIVMGRLFDRATLEQCLEQCDLMDVDPERECGVEGRQLSGGQRQRVALARLAYGQPSVCLLDDPLAGLDQKCADLIMSKLFDQDGGLLGRSTVVIATSCPELIYGRLDYEVVVSVERTQQPLTVNYDTVKKSIITTNSTAQRQYGKPVGSPQPTSTDHSDADTYNLKRVLSKYFVMSGGIAAVVAILAAFTIEQIVKKQQASIIMSVFANTNPSNNDSKSPINTMEMCYPYLLMSMMMAAAKIAYSVLFTLCHTQAASRLHDLFVRCLGTSRRVADRLNNMALGMASRDMQIVDIELCSAVQGFIGTVSVVIGAASVILFVPDGNVNIMAALSVLMAAVWVCGAALFYCYNRAWREARRLLSIHNAKIIDKVTESAKGLLVIKGLPESAKMTIQDRLYDDIVSVGQAQQFYTTVRRWATLYLEALPISTRLLIDCVSVLLRIRPEIRVIVGEALIGNAEVFEMLSKRLSMVDSALLSFDMMLEVAEEAERGKQILYTNDRLTVTDRQGAALQFDDYSASIGNQQILSNISFSIKEGERVAVVGRTGAGKSSLFNAIFNTLSEGFKTSGSISIYGRAISQFNGIVPNLVIITQDPCLVSASVRFNMDPLASYTDDAIKRALKRVQLDIDLDMDIDKVNMSAAERQCFALARAILNCQPGSILLVDEVAARTDQSVLDMMTRVIMDLPKSVTVIAIMHRVSGTFDRVLEMSSGRLISDSQKQ